MQPASSSARTRLIKGNDFHHIFDLGEEPDMTQLTQAAPDSAAIIQRDRLLHLLALMTFIIFFRAYMVAPSSNATNMKARITS
jgi:hypothetical protein